MMSKPHIEFQSHTSLRSHHWPANDGHLIDKRPKANPRRSITNISTTTGQIKMLTATSIQRPVAEAFIQAIFKQHHNAEIQSFLPLMLGVFNPEGQITAAVGYRCAARESLYLENYLDQGIDTLVSDFIGHPVPREQIVEVGNLASLQPASCKALFKYLVQHLHQQGIQWISCTGTAVLRIVFRRLGIKAQPMHEADQNRLGDEQFLWGSYYDNDPQIMLINVGETHNGFLKGDQVASH